MAELLGGISGLVVAICFGFLFIFWPALLIYCAWRLLRDVRRIADALEHRSYDAPRVAPAPAPAHTEPVITRSPGIATSAFGR